MKYLFIIFISIFLFSCGQLQDELDKESNSSNKQQINQKDLYTLWELSNIEINKRSYQNTKKIDFYGHVYYLITEDSTLIDYRKFKIKNSQQIPCDYLEIHKHEHDINNKLFKNSLMTQIYWNEKECRPTELTDKKDMITYQEKIKENKVKQLILFTRKYIPNTLNLSEDVYTILTLNKIENENVGISGESTFLNGSKIENGIEQVLKETIVNDNGSTVTVENTDNTTIEVEVTPVANTTVQEEENVSETRTYTCIDLPKNSKWFNNISSFEQTFNGTDWLPISTNEFKSNNNTSGCLYKCKTNFYFDGKKCTKFRIVKKITNLYADDIDFLNDSILTLNDNNIFINSGFTSSGVVFTNVSGIGLLGNVQKIYSNDDNIFVVSDNQLNSLNINGPSINFKESYSVTSKVIFYDNYLYFIETNTLKIVDLNNPANPINHGSYTRNGISHIEVNDNYIYLVDSNLSKLRILNASDKLDITDLSSYNLDSNVKDLLLISNYLYVANGSGGLILLDVNDYDNINKLATLKSNNDVSQELFLSDDILYVSNGDNGLSLYNVSDPSRPFMVGKYKALFDINRAKKYDDYLYITDKNNQVIILFSMDY